MGDREHQAIDMTTAACQKELIASSGASLPLSEVPVHVWSRSVPKLFLPLLLCWLLSLLLVLDSLVISVPPFFFLHSLPLRWPSRCYSLG